LDGDDGFAGSVLNGPGFEDFGFRFFMFPLHKRRHADRLM
jgi:hypothetical protein